MQTCKLQSLTVSVSPSALTQRQSRVSDSVGSWDSRADAVFRKWRGGGGGVTVVS